jgi:hypothetical protein
MRDYIVFYICNKPTWFTDKAKRTPVKYLFQQDMVGKEPSNLPALFTVGKDETITIPIPFKKYDPMLLYQSVFLEQHVEEGFSVFVYGSLKDLIWSRKYITPVSEQLVSLGKDFWDYLITDSYCANGTVDFRFTYIPKYTAHPEHICHSNEDLSKYLGYFLFQFDEMDGSFNALTYHREFYDFMAKNDILEGPSYEGESSAVFFLSKSISEFADRIRFACELFSLDRTVNKKVVQFRRETAAAAFEELNKGE